MYNQLGTGNHHGLLPRFSYLPHPKAHENVWHVFDKIFMQIISSLSPPTFFGFQLPFF
jgi:hypothetical protein